MIPTNKDEFISQCNYCEEKCKEEDAIYFREGIPTYETTDFCSINCLREFLNSMVWDPMDEEWVSVEDYGKHPGIIFEDCNKQGDFRGYWSKNPMVDLKMLKNASKHLHSDA